MGKWNLGNIIDPSGLLVGGGMTGSKGIMGLFDDDQEEIPLKQVPEYPESTAARSTWWDAIKGGNAENLYGAISPDWSEIWEQAQKRLKSTYYGSPTSIGTLDRVKASAARRNVSDSPALQTMIGRLGAQEAQDTSALASELATKQAQFGETARGNWLNQLASLSGQQASYYYPQYEESNLDKFIKILGAGAQAVGSVASLFKKE